MTAQKNATVLLAHGSSDANWLAPFNDLLIRIRSGLDTQRVELAYMELAHPSMEDQIRQLATEGFSKIDILPLFFAAGRHLRKDVPGQLDTLKAALADRGTRVELILPPPVGLEPEVSSAISNIVIRQVSAES